MANPHGGKYWTDERKAVLFATWPKGKAALLETFPDKTWGAISGAYSLYRTRPNETARAKRTAAEVIADRIAETEERAKRLREKRNALIRAEEEREAERARRVRARRLPVLAAKHRNALEKAEAYRRQCVEIDPTYGAAATAAPTTLAGIEGIRAAQGQPFSEATMRVLRAGNDDVPPPVPDCVTHGDLLHIKKRVDHVVPAMVAQLRRELKVDARSVVVAVVWCLRKMLVSRDETTLAFLDGKK